MHIALTDCCPSEACIDCAQTSSGIAFSQHPILSSRADLMKCGGHVYHSLILSSHFT